MSRTITSPQYILLYTTEPIDLVGKKSWFYQGIYDSEEQAVAALLAMPDSSYEHARVVKTILPCLTVPDDFDTIIGEPTHA